MLTRDVVLLGRELGLPLGVGFYYAARGGHISVIGKADNVVPGLHGFGVGSDKRVVVLCKRR
jgi:hypothetical protein